MTAEQQARAEELVAATLRELPQFADVAAVPALGYRSIGDASTDFEHYINVALINDDRFLDPSAPESLVYRVDGRERTLVSAMFIAKETPIDDPSLTEFAGPLMQWHVHDNLCWGLNNDGQPVVKGLVDPDDGPARLAPSMPAARTPWSTSGSHHTSADRSQPWRVTAQARRA